MTATALTIAGSDSGGGAGIQADLKTFSALGVYGASVITAITAQNSCTITAVEEISATVIAAQIDAVLSDIDVHAIKIGMLATPEIIETVAQGIAHFHGPIVLDPVMFAKSGEALLADSAVSSLIHHLLPRATLLTPNLPEAARLLGTVPATTPEEAVAQGHELCRKGALTVLIKGGHAAGAVCTDVLVAGDDDLRFEAPRIATRNTHGTGCTMSSAIAAELAKGAEIAAAVQRAHHWLHRAIQAAEKLEIGQGHGPVHHFHEIWK